MEGRRSTVDPGTSKTNPVVSMPPEGMSIRRLVLRKVWAGCWALLALGICQGCAQWSREAEVDPAPLLPPPQKSLDSVVVETVLVRFSANKVDPLQTVWRDVDESIFDIEFRELLDKNGLRAGVLLGELPQVIREQIQQTSYQQNTDALEHAGLAADVDNKMRKLQCRSGRRKDLIVRREVRDELTVLTTLDGRTVSGETYLQPAVLFDLRAVPHGDGQATIELTPEIQHGEHRQSFVSTEFGVRPEMRRSQQTWHQLKIGTRLHPGQILMVAGTQPSKALGRAFFTTKTAEQTEEHVVLLVRLAETQLDELFAPEEIEQAAAMAER